MIKQCDTRIVVFFSEIIKTSLVTFYTTLKRYFNGSKYISFGRIHQEIGLFLNKSLNLFWKKVCFLVIFDILPKCIVLVAFLLDVIVFHKFFFFYKLSFLLIFPLIISFLLYTFEDICIINIGNYNSIFCFLNEEEEEITAEGLYYYYVTEENFYLEKYPIGINKKMMYEYAGTNYCAETTVVSYINTLYYCFFPIALFFFLLGLIRDLYSKYLTVILYFGYMVGWGYVVYYGI